MTKDELQDKYTSLIEHKRVAVQWATGLGKSRLAINMINYIKPVGEFNILLIVAEIAHKANWQEEFKKWKLPDNCKLTVECYASLKKYRDTKWDTIIYDEAHHLGTDIRLDIIDTISAKYIILLSATLPVDLIQYLERIYGKFVSTKININKAIDLGLLPQPKIYLIPLKLDNQNYDYEVMEEWGIKSKRQVIKCAYNQRWKYMANRKAYPNTTLIMSCTQKQKYDYYTEKSEYYKNAFMKQRLDRLKNIWMLMGSQRKKFLGESKTEAAYKLITKYNLLSKRFICFCTSIIQAEALGGVNTIHSKKKNSQSIILDFNDKKISNLFAVNMLQEGQNLVDIEVGIIIQMDGSERSFIQKSGRVYRADSPIQYIIYYKDTRDEEYLRDALNGINPEYITELELN